VAVARHPPSSYRGPPPLPFARRGKGTASPIWNMQLIEVPGLAEPTLIDPALLGVLYVATGTLLVDIYTGLSTNEVPHPPGVRCACFTSATSRAAMSSKTKVNKPCAAQQVSLTNSWNSWIASPGLTPTSWKNFPIPPTS
jgi:hypothetical protein